MALTTLQLERYADVLIWGLETARTGRFQPYDGIMIRFELSALPLVEILHKKLIQQKKNVSFRLISTPEMERNFYLYSDSVQRKFISKGEKEFFQSLNGNIFISAPASLTHLKDIDPKKMNEVMISRRPLRKIMEDREAKGLFGWTLCAFTTKALAEKARMTEAEYTDQIVKACYLSEKDPIAKWKEIFKASYEIRKWLNALPVKTINVKSKRTDLTISLGESRRFLGVSGHNIPSYEMFVSPDWRGTEGVYFADQPSFRSGNYVRDVKLVFKKGRAVSVSAAEGESYAKKTLATDRGACQIGEFSLTDRRFSKIDRFMADTLYDENFGGKYGNCHIAVGNSYADTFLGNQAKLTDRIKKSLGFNESALHWDLVNIEDKTVTAKLKDGRSITLYENGMFKY